MYGENRLCPFLCAKGAKGGIVLASNESVRTDSALQGLAAPMTPQRKDDVI